MKCEFCEKEFEEKDLQESHDVPCYLFKGNRQGRKNQADKFGRHWLCEDCHKKYEKCINDYLIRMAIKFAEGYKDGI